MSYATEKAYVSWAPPCFIRFHRLRHPGEMGEAEVRAFLTWLAVERHVAAATQNQALSVLNRGGLAVRSPLGAVLRQDGMPGGV